MATPPLPTTPTAIKTTSAGYDTYYHYTDQESGKKIIESQTILQSEVKHGDARKGDGSYINQLPPFTSKNDVAKNNYDGATKQWEDKKHDGKTDVIIEMKLPKDEVQDHSKELKRNVHLYPGNIDLSKAKDVKVHVKTGDTSYKTLEPLKKESKK